MDMKDDCELRLLEGIPPDADLQQEAPVTETGSAQGVAMEWTTSTDNEDAAPLPLDDLDAPADEPADPRPRKEPTGVFAPAVAGPHGRFWEKTAAFWCISLPGIAGSCMVMWLGALEPLIACTLACGLCAGIAAFGAVPSAAPRAAGPRHVLLPVLLVSLIIGSAMLLGIRALLFRPTTAQIIAWGIACYVMLFYLLSFIGPLGAYAAPRNWFTEVWQMSMNWHRAVGIAALTTAGVLLAAPAALVLGFAPRRFGPRLGRIAEDEFWSWLLLPAEMCLRVPVFERGLKPPSSSPIVRALATSLRAISNYLAAVPLIAGGCWFVLLTTATRLLTEMNSACLAAACENAAAQRLVEAQD